MSGGGASVLLRWGEPAAAEFNNQVQLIGTESRQDTARRGAGSRGTVDD